MLLRGHAFSVNGMCDVYCKMDLCTLFEAQALDYYCLMLQRADLETVNKHVYAHTHTHMQFCLKLLHVLALQAQLADPVPKFH